MSILILGTFLDTLAAFAVHILFTLGNTTQITQRGRDDVLRFFKVKQVAARYADLAVKQSPLGSLHPLADVATLIAQSHQTYHPLGMSLAVSFRTLQARLPQLCSHHIHR